MEQEMISEDFFELLEEYYLYGFIENEEQKREPIVSKYKLLKTRGIFIEE